MLAYITIVPSAMETATNCLSIMFGALWNLDIRLWR